MLSVALSCLSLTMYPGARTYSKYSVPGGGTHYYCTPCGPVLQVAAPYSGYCRIDSTNQGVVNLISIIPRRDLLLHVTES